MRQRYYFLYHNLEFQCLSTVVRIYQKHYNNTFNFIDCRLDEDGYKPSEEELDVVAPVAVVSPFQSVSLHDLTKNLAANIEVFIIHTYTTNPAYIC